MAIFAFSTSLVYAEPVSSGTSATLTAEESMAWQADLDYLVTELPKLHKDAFFSVSEQEFLDNATLLRVKIPGLDRDEIIAGLARQVALIGDSHTSLNIFSTGVQFFPFQLEYFSDGWRVLATHPDQSAALGCIPLAIDGQPLCDVEIAVREAFSFSNDSGARAQLPTLLIIGPLLYGLGVTADPLLATWTFLDEKGESFDLQVPAMSPGSIQGWPTVWDASVPKPMYRQQVANPYFYIWNSDLEIIYFQYNSCRERDDLSFTAFSEMLFEAFDQYPFEKFIIDLRFNSGGNSGIADGLIDNLAADGRVNQPGKVFVIIGRNTFSSAVLNAISLRQKTAAVFVGEPSGGSPNHFGELGELKLPNSGITVSYSTKYFKWADGDADAIYPDLAAPVSYADFIAGRDPALEAILAQ